LERAATVPVASAKENHMTSRKTKIAALTALLSLGALGATYAATDAAKGHETDEASEVAFILSAKHSLIDAITTAEKRATGKALEANLEVEDGKAYYEVTTLSKTGLFEAKIDANTGMVLSAQPEDGDDEAGERLSPTGMSITEAVKAAEAAAGGKAMEAELEDQDGIRIFEVELASADGSVKTVAVNVETREVTAMADDDERDEKTDN